MSVAHTVPLSTGPLAAGSLAQGALTAGPVPAGQSGQSAQLATGCSDELQAEVECVNIVQLTAHTKSFELRPCDGTRLQFEPGQYLTLTVPHLGVDRCYSISSAPTGGETLTITVKRVPGGPVSEYLHDHFGIGDRLYAAGPYGVFTPTYHPAGKYLFLTAGSGITPVMSMLSALAARPLSDPLDVVVIYHSRTLEDIIFYTELRALSQRWGVELVFVLTAPEANWAGRAGRLSAAQVLAHAPDVTEREVFACGPTGYLTTARDIIADVGVAAANYHEESYVFGLSTLTDDAGGEVNDEVTAASAPAVDTRTPDAAVPLTIVEQAPESFAVEFRSRGCTLACPAGTTVLAAAQEAGITLPSSCAEGMCGTCKSTLVAGEVQMDHGGGIRPREITQGKFLPCCSVPLTDLVVE